MRKNLLFLSFCTLVLFSCSAIKEAITVPINTTLQVDIPFSVAVTKSGLLSEKAGTTYSFTAEKVLQVADNIDMTSYINKIKSVDLKAVSIAIGGLKGSEEVLTLDVAVSGISGPIFSQTNITATTNNPFSPTVTSALQAQLDLLEPKVVSDRKLTITVSGTTNAAPLTLTAKLSFDARFVCMPLN